MESFHFARYVLPLSFVREKLSIFYREKDRSKLRLIKGALRCVISSRLLKDVVSVNEDSLGQNERAN